MTESLLNNLNDDPFCTNIDSFRQRYNELEEQLSDPIIFKDAVLAAELSRDHGRVKGIIEAFEEIKVLEAQLEETEGLLSDEEFVETAQEEIDSLQPKIKLAGAGGDDAGRNTILRAGAGGDEAFSRGFVSHVLQILENRNWSLDCLSQSLSESVGLRKSFSLSRAKMLGQNSNSRAVFIVCKGCRNGSQWKNSHFHRNGGRLTRGKGRNTYRSKRS